MSRSFSGLFDVDWAMIFAVFKVPDVITELTTLSGKSALAIIGPRVGFAGREPLPPWSILPGTTGLLLR
jgi:hypothetical protein